MAMSSNSVRRLTVVCLRAGLPLAAILALGACATAQSDRTSAPIAATPTQQFPLQATGHADEIRLQPHAAGLSREQAEALAALAGRWQEVGGGPLTIQIPDSSPDPRAAYRGGAEARLVLQNSGAPAELVRQVGYEPAAGAPAVIIVGFTAYEPVIAHCGTHWNNIANTYQNKPMSNFGCAVTSNMAAQIANPADIEGPRLSDPPDAARRTVVIDSYRQGKLTAGAKDAQSSGAVSATGGGSGGSSGGSGN